MTIKSSLSDSEELKVSQWPTSAITAHVSDFNLDGYFDLNLRNIDTALPRVNDQIVFAKTQTAPSPSAIRPVDAQFQKYFKEVYEWVLNPNYFVENADYENETRFFTETVFLGYVSNLADSGCPNFYNLCYYVTGVDLIASYESRGESTEDIVAERFYIFAEYSVYETRSVTKFEKFNPDALTTGTIPDSAFANGEAQTDGSVISQIENILKDVIGVDIDFPNPKQERPLQLIFYGG